MNVILKLSFLTKSRNQLRYLKPSRIVWKKDKTHMKPAGMTLPLL